MKGQSCIVVGGASGIGGQICFKLLENEVANLAILDVATIPTDLFEEMKKKCPKTQIVYFKCDVTIKDEIETTFNSVESMFQTVDIIINTVGIANENNIELTFKINVFGLMYVTMLGLKLMSKERRKSSTEAILINFASIAGLDPMYQAPIYSASKCAVVGFCRAFSHDILYNASGVRMIVICPSQTATNFIKESYKNVPNQDEYVELTKSLPPQSPEIVAEHTMQLLRSAKNGSIWIMADSKLSEVTMASHYTQ